MVIWVKKYLNGFLFLNIIKYRPQLSKTAAMMNSLRKIKKF